MHFTEEDKLAFKVWHEELRKRAKVPKIKNKWFDFIHKNAGIRQYPGFGHWSELRLLLYYKRYQEAGKLLKGAKSILDWGTGAGYGCEILSDYVEKVVGYDIDPKAIEFANDFHKISSTITFTDKMPTDMFDGIVAIESIEHVADIPSWIETFNRQLTPNGKLIMSTPNMKLENIGFFKTRMKLPEFEKLLKKYFEVEVLESNPINWTDKRSLSWYFICKKKNGKD